MIYYTSDLHFFHKNVIQYCNRPWATVDDMNAGLVQRWNARVTPNDDVYVIGDFSFGSMKKTQPIFDSLNGRKHLVAGNHDGRDTRSLNWASYSTLKQIHDCDKLVVMCHYAFSVWNKSQHGSLNLFGHSHGSHPGNQQQMDVGVDVWDYQPVTLPEIMAKMATLPPYKQNDYHQRHHNA